MKVQGIHIEHPGARERAKGAESEVYMNIDRGLKSGRQDRIPLDQRELIKLLAEGAKVLAIVNDVRVSP